MFARVVEGGELEARQAVQRRSMTFAAWSIPANVAMVGWKTSLIVVTPSFFLLASIVVSIGVAGAKMVAIRAHRSGSRTGASASWQLERRAYRVIGGIITALALAFMLSCAPLLVGQGPSEQYHRYLAIAIATITFIELGVSMHGVLRGRGTSLIVQAVRLTNLAGACVLLVLTQTALLSIAHHGDARSYNGISGILFGSIAAVIGAVMLLRPLGRSEPIQANSPGAR